MDRSDARVRSWLTVDAGFSKANAAITIELYKQGKLDPKERKILEDVYINRTFSCAYTKGLLLDALNYRITTQHGGVARGGMNRGRTRSTRALTAKGHGC